MQRLLVGTLIACAVAAIAPWADVRFGWSTKSPTFLLCDAHGRAPDPAPTPQRSPSVADIVRALSSDSVPSFEARGRKRFIQAGVIALGPERASFLPCGISEQWWLDGIEARAGAKTSPILNAQPYCDLDTMPCRWQTVYIEALVTTSDLDHVGHEGGYSRYVNIHDVVHAKRKTPKSCATRMAI